MRSTFPQQETQLHHIRTKKKGGREQIRLSSEGGMIFTPLDSKHPTGFMAGII